MFNFLKRDFMLGVGAGLIISGIMVSFSGNGQMTDEEVRARAAKLGMIQKQEMGTSQSKAEQEKSQPQNPEPQQPEPQNTGQVGTSPASQAVDVQKSSPEKGHNGFVGTAPAPALQEEEVILIEIKPGMGSETVTAILEQKGAINDREEFYKVLTKYKAHSKLKVGIFKIPAGTDMKVIVDILTGKVKAIDN